MNFEIEVTRENEDGSADLLVHIDKDAMAIIIQEGIEAILWKYIEQYKKIE
jgi:hypothetical protein